jgi:putative ATP-dependent endonuclease of the OLD family
MKICRIEITNYRSIEHIVLNLDRNYMAISGKNNSGKSNLLRAVRAVLTEDEPWYINDGVELDYGSDFPRWKSKDRDKEKDGSGEPVREKEPVKIEVTLRIFRDKDASVFRFLDEFLQLKKATDVEFLEVKIVQVAKHDASGQEQHVMCDGSPVSDAFKASEIARRIRTSKGFVFHNSINLGSPARYMGSSMFSLNVVSPEERDAINTARDKLTGVMKKSAERHQKEIIEIIGKLEERYQVSLDVPRLGIENMPLRVSLGDKGSTIPLSAWGSGTQNRTEILMALMRAKKSSENPVESDRIAPIIVLEEPESFLHPSAQAEFGQLLQDLSNQFDIQLIVSTHSPYMLSLSEPEQNLLLSRSSAKGAAPSTCVITTTGESWMEPYGRALGIDNAAFASWKNLLFKPASEILLVEGVTDVDYFKLLRDPKHGDKALKFEGEIFPYEGTGFFSNTVLLKFILARFRRVVVTFDLDKLEEVESKLKGLELQKSKDYFAIGQNKPGLKDIEGLLPEGVRSSVYAANTAKVAHAHSGEKDRHNARSELKKLLFNELSTRSFDAKDFALFYDVARQVEKAMR